MKVIPCEANEVLREQIEQYAEVLRVEAHTLGNHGLSEEEFYNSGLFRGAIERLRGQFSATMRGKREFVRDILNFMQDREAIQDWESAGEGNRHDYKVVLNSGRIAIIETKGCLDGNNTNIFTRPSHANEFVIWSLCTNSGANLAHNIWSGIHTRLSAEIITSNQQVDGLIAWDMACGTLTRPCPKIHNQPERRTEVSHFSVTPPCIYVFPSTIASLRNNPNPVAQSLQSVELLKSLHNCFKGNDDEVNYVDFAVQARGAETLRTTTIRRAGAIQRQSRPTAIRRS